MRKTRKIVVLFLLMTMILLVPACSKEKEKENNPRTPEPVVTIPIQTEKEPKIIVEEPAVEAPEQREEELPEGELPSLDLAKYRDHKGLLFMLAYTELLKAQRYSEAAKFFTPEMIAEIGYYGYENPELYLQDIFEGSRSEDVRFALYEVNDEYILSGITRSEGLTPFSTHLENGEWVLNFSAFN